MIVTHSVDGHLLSNAFLVADRPGGLGVIIDAGAPAQPLVDAAERLGLTVRHLLLTHHHDDHVSQTGALREGLGVEVYAHPAEGQWLEGIDHHLVPGRPLEVGELEILPLHTPGHTAGGLAYLINRRAVFTGDTLFKGSIGCLWATGATSFADHRQAIMGALMGLPLQTTIFPGHSLPSTVGAEWSTNPFIRRWRGLDEDYGASCTMAGRPAKVVVWARDYDDGHKAWLRWDDNGEDDVMPGSKLMVAHPGQAGEPVAQPEPAAACRLPAA